jgi:hypothetical protein
MILKRNIISSKIEDDGTVDEDFFIGQGAGPNSDEGTDTLGLHLYSIIPLLYVL